MTKSSLINFILYNQNDIDWEYKEYSIDFPMTRPQLEAMDKDELQGWYEVVADALRTEQNNYHNDYTYHGRS